MKSYIVKYNEKTIYVFIQKNQIEKGSKWQYEIKTSLDECKQTYKEETEDPQYRHKKVIREFLIAKNEITKDEKIDMNEISIQKGYLNVIWIKDI